MRKNNGIIIVVALSITKKKNNIPFAANKIPKLYKSNDCETSGKYSAERVNLLCERKRFFASRKSRVLIISEKKSDFLIFVP